MVSDLISKEEKRQALERVLGSRTFGRSDQLRGFLRYICEAEFEGRATELNEYVLGVSVLGRPNDYSPAEDSCVRTRAYELRNKLKSYYRLEAPGDPVQIEIRKGAYVPQFQRTTEATPAEISAAAEPVPLTAAVVSPPPPTAGNPARARTVLNLSLGLALAAVVAATVVSVYALWARPAKAPDLPGWTPEMTAFWKPFLDSGTPVIISFEIRLFFYSPSTGLVVRDYQTNQLADLAASKPLTEFRKRMGNGELQETQGPCTRRFSSGGCWVRGTAKLA